MVDNGISPPMQQPRQVGKLYVYSLSQQTHLYKGNQSLLMFKQPDLFAFLGKNRNQLQLCLNIHIYQDIFQYPILLIQGKKKSTPVNCHLLSVSNPGTISNYATGCGCYY